MRVHFEPGVCRGTVTVPPSKSMAHRTLICAALAEGESVIENLAFSQDIEATIRGLTAFGAACGGFYRSCERHGLAQSPCGAD